jgi:hypothetical protein
MKKFKTGLDSSLHKFLKCLRQGNGVSLGSSFTAISLIKFCKYKLAVVDQVKFQIMQQEFTIQTSCCKMHDGIMDPQVLFTINGAWFYLSGRVKPQNI